MVHPHCRDGSGLLTHPRAGAGRTALPLHSPMPTAAAPHPPVARPMAAAGAPCVRSTGNYRTVRTLRLRNFQVLRLSLLHWVSPRSSKENSALLTPETAIMMALSEILHAPLSSPVLSSLMTTAAPSARHTGARLSLPSRRRGDPRPPRRRRRRRRALARAPGARCGGPRARGRSQSQLISRASAVRHGPDTAALEVG
jgi:hypothetical protein